MSFDDGLQPERTALAWRRTGLVAAVGGLALVRVAVARGSVAVAALLGGIVLVAAATLFEGIGELRARAVLARAPTLPVAATATTVVIVVLGVVGTVLLLES